MVLPLFLLYGDAMKTRCVKCRKLIEYGNSYCDVCYSNLLKTRKNDVKNKRVEATTKSGLWKAVRRKIILRDKCCLLCLKRHGYYELRTLQVHHIIKRVEDESLIYEPSNLVTLCRSCHEEMEKLSVKEQRELLEGCIKEIDYSIL